MKILILIPVVLFYAFFAFACALTILCALYCRWQSRIARKREAAASRRASTDDVQTPRSAPAKRRFAKARAFSTNFLYGLSRYASVVIGKIPSHHLRKFLAKHVLCLRFHPQAVLYGGFELRSPWNVQIGRSVIGVGALLDGRWGIVIEDDACLAQATAIFSGQHDVNDDNFGIEGQCGPVIIKRCAWVSSRATVLPKCVVEEGVVIASGAVLTRSTEPYGIYGGIPAKRIAERKSPMNYKLAVDNYWRFY